MNMTAITDLIKAFIVLITTLSVIIGNSVNPPLEPFVPEEIIDTPAEVETMTIIDNGISAYRIICGKPEGDPEYTAALKLQYYLNQISGVTLPIVSDIAPSTAKEFIVGKTNREGAEYTVDRSSFGSEDVNVFTLGQKIIIAGAEKRGTLYGVYAFLEEALGCRWYAYDVISLPHGTTVNVPVDLHITQKPILEYRETDWISPKDIEYSLANHLNGNTYRHLSEENGSFKGYVGGFCHTMTNSICTEADYYASHPEYFAIHDGERTPKQLCLSNPDVLNIVIAQTKALLQSDPDAIVSLTQDDNQDYCECDACKAIDDYEGSHAGTMITFVNQVADAIKEEYPDALIDTFAYQYTRTPPLHVVPRDNVIVRLCSIECCFAHALDDPNCEENAAFAADLKTWATLTNHLYVWDYTTNYGHFAGPFPNFGILQDNMQFFAENHVVGLYEEGDYSASSCDVEFADYRAYLLSRLMWNPYCDLDAESDGFFKTYYGDGWQYVKEYVRMTVANCGQDGEHMHIFDAMTDKGVLDLTKNEIAYMDDLWAHAKELTAADAVTNEHVLRSEISWRYWKACNKVDEFSRTGNPTGWVGENEKLYNDMKGFNVTMLREGRQMDEVTNFSGTPVDWRG